MGSSYNLTQLDNETVLSQLTRLLGHDRQQEAEILAHIGEVDARKLYADAAYSSMFGYCLSELHLSEAEAYRRITAARLARRFPILLQKVAAGELHLCAIKLLAPHINESNCAQLLALATHASKTTVEKRLTALFPKEPVEDSVRKLPAPRQSTAGSLTSNLDAAPAAPDSLQLARPQALTASPAVVAEASLARHRPRDTVAPLAADLYKIQFTANETLRTKLERAKELLPVGGSDLATIFDRALDSLIGELERKRFGSKQRAKVAKKQRAKVAKKQGAKVAKKQGAKVAKKQGAKVAKRQRAPVLEPVTNKKSPASRKRSRTIARAVRREVDRRDGGQCTFARADGMRCSERRALEMHHLQPFARGGQNMANNLTLRCKTHNLHAAEIDFGSRVMQRFRTREPAALYDSAPRRA